MWLPLIAILSFLLIYVIFKKVKSNKEKILQTLKERKEDKKEEKKETAKKKISRVWTGTVVILIILAAIGWFGYRYFSEYKTQSHPVYTIPTEKWYLSSEQYWKENGGMEQAQAIKVDVSEHSIYVIYKLLRRNGQYGELLAESEDGKIYTGRYQYPGESGDVKLKKLHATLYEGMATRPNGTIMKIQLLKSPL